MYCNNINLKAYPFKYNIYVILLYLYKSLKKLAIILGEKYVATTNIFTHHIAT